MNVKKVCSIIALSLASIGAQGCWQDLLSAGAAGSESSSPQVRISLPEKLTQWGHFPAESTLFLVQLCGSGVNCNSLGCLRPQLLPFQQDGAFPEL